MVLETQTPVLGLSRSPLAYGGETPHTVPGRSERPVAGPLTRRRPASFLHPLSDGHVDWLWRSPSDSSGGGGGLTHTEHRYNCLVRYPDPPNRSSTVGTWTIPEVVSGSRSGGPGVKGVSIFFWLSVLVDKNLRPPVNLYEEVLRLRTCGDFWGRTFIGGSWETGVAGPGTGVLSDSFSGRRGQSTVCRPRTATGCPEDRTSTTTSS